MLKHIVSSCFAKPVTCDAQQEAFSNFPVTVEEYSNREPVKIHGKNGTTTIEHTLKREVETNKHLESTRRVILPENSPLRKLNIDRFELTKYKVPTLGKHGLTHMPEKILSVLDKEGNCLVCGAEDIRNFMKSIKNLIRHV